MSKTPLLEIDLGDGLPPARIESTEKKAKVSERLPVRFTAPEKIEITYTPVAVVISVAPIRCLSCGATHQDHRGIFIDNKLSNGVRALKRISLKELGAFATLPRRVDVAPAEAVPICGDCWLIEKVFREAVATAQAEGELFGEPGASRPIAEIASELKSLHEDGMIDIDLEDSDETRQ